MSCCSSQIKAVHSVIGNSVTSQYFDLRNSPPTQMTQEEYDALELVSCPKTETDIENVCLQEAGNTDAANIVKGMRCVNKLTTYSDTQGTVDNVSITSVTLHLADATGTNVTETHEEVACPVPTIIETSACVKPA
jgi:hypothetical protein